MKLFGKETDEDQVEDERVQDEVEEVEDNDEDEEEEQDERSNFSKEAGGIRSRFGED